MTTKRYHIVRLLSENVKRIKAIEITPEGNVVELTGENGAGKTSVIDSIYYALTGKKVIPREPIRRGQDKAKIQVDMGELIITRGMTLQEDGSYTTTLTVETDTGMMAKSPQDMLKSIVGALTADPLAFIDLKPEQQFEQLKMFVPGFDFDANAAARKKRFELRTDSNRRVKELAARVDAILIAEGEPPARVDESALVAALEQAGEHNTEIERRKANRRTVEARIARREENILARDNENQLDKRKIEQLQEQIKRRNEAHNDDLAANEEDQKMLNAAPALPEPIDTGEIRAKIAAARDTNQAADEYSRKVQMKQELAGEITLAQAISRDFTAEIEQIDTEKEKAITTAKMPVDGIGFGDGYVTLDGFPFDQASASAQMRAAIALAMAANPQVRVLLIRDASRLDKKSWQLLADMARENDFQVWAESVESDRPGAIIIEDGAVRAKQQE